MVSIKRNRTGEVENEALCQNSGNIPLMQVYNSHVPQEETLQQP